MTDRPAEVRRQLAAIPALLLQLPGYLRPGSRPLDPDDPGGKRPKASFPPMLVVLDVIDLSSDLKHGWLGWEPGDDHERARDQTGWRHGVLGTLRVWAWRAAWDGHDGESCVAVDAVGVCRWLADHAEYMIGRYPGFAADVAQMHDRLARTCGIRPEPRYFCPTCEWAIEPRDQGAWWSCTGCRRTWTYASEIDRLMAAQADVVTLRAAASEIGRPVGTLRRWKAAGWLTPIARRSGVDHYSLAAVRRVAETVRWGYYPRVS